MKMYSTEKEYQFEVKTAKDGKTLKIFYTGKVLDEDDVNVKIKTIRDEEIILLKTDISRSRVVTNG